MTGKTFLIGLSRTGTRSTIDALHILGHKVAHWTETIPMLRESNGALELELDEVETYDALGDIVISRFYRELDARFPGSRFILTVRDIEPWLRTCERKYPPISWYIRRLWDRQDYSRRAHLLHTDLYGSARFDRTSWERGYHRHVDGVVAYFAGRPADLLVIDPSKGEGWEKLCSFVSLPAPSVPYPHVGRSRKHRAPQWFNALVTRFLGVRAFH